MAVLTDSSISVTCNQSKSHARELFLKPSVVTLMPYVVTSPPAMTDFVVSSLLMPYVVTSPSAMIDFVVSNLLVVRIGRMTAGLPGGR